MKSIINQITKYHRLDDKVRFDKIMTQHESLREYYTYYYPVKTDSFLK